MQPLLLFTDLIFIGFLLRVAIWMWRVDAEVQVIDFHLMPWWSGRRCVMVASLSLPSDLFVFCLRRSVLHLWLFHIPSICTTSPSSPHLCFFFFLLVCYYLYFPFQNINNLTSVPVMLVIFWLYKGLNLHSRRKEECYYFFVNYTSFWQDLSGKCRVKNYNIYLCGLQTLNVLYFAFLLITKRRNKNIRSGIHLARALWDLDWI